MPICIAGMHRSGTSMVSRLLNLCGVYLGPENELLPPRPDNPEGYWENLHFVDINDRVLAQLDAGWDLAPAVSKGWEMQPEFDALRKESADLIERFNAHEPWGWKDPRNSLTLPFWRHLIPNLKVLIVLRNPLEAALSLHARNFSSLTLGLKLWLAHNQRILSAVRPKDRVITHYDSYFYAPRAELRRVLDELNIAASDKGIDRACTTVSDSLRHQRVPTDSLSSEVPLEVVECYLELCEHAGPVYQASLGSEDYVPWQLDEKNRIIRLREQTITGLENELFVLRKRCGHAEDLNQSLQGAISHLQSDLSASRETNRLLKAKVEEREALVHARNEAITSLHGELAELVTSNFALSSQLSAKTAELERLTRSYGWRALRRYGWLKYRYLLPIYRMLGFWPYSRDEERDNRELTPAATRRLP